MTVFSNIKSRPQGVFILGTDTEVGKTYQAAKLARHLWLQGTRIGVYKPVASGCTLAAHGQPHPASDADILRAAAQLDCPVQRVCPQVFEAPLAPPLAARLEDRCVDETLLVDGYLWWHDQCEFMIVEGVGGALSPISESMTALDLAQKLELPAIIVARNRLGVVSQTLLTIEATLSRGLQILGVVLNTIPGEPNSPTDGSLASNLGLLAKFACDIPIVTSIDQLVPSIAKQQRGT